MTDNGRRSAAEPETPVSETPADPASSPAQENPEAIPEPDPLDVLKAENAELKDRLLRTLAEMDNLRKRTEREKAEATLYAASNFARDLLNVPDSLARALAAVPPQDREKADEATRNLLAGVEVTERELMNVLQRHGIRRIDPQGEKFDPHFHQAMFEVPSDTAPPGTVVEVIHPGYAIGERLLRPALVGVSKAG